MVTRIILVLLAIAALSAKPAFADTYSCSCAKKEKYKGEFECASSTVSVEIKSKSTEKTAASRCHVEFGNTCPSYACAATATRTSASTDQPADASKKTKSSTSSSTSTTSDHVLGVKNEHLDAFKKYAKEKKWTIIIRESNADSLPFQDDFAAYRPKPTLIFYYNTRKGADTGNGLIDCRPITDEYELSKWPKRTKYSKRLDNKEYLQKAKWTCKNGLIHDPQGKQVYGDYDLQGVYQHKGSAVTLVDMNPANVRLEMNKAVFPDRIEALKKAFPNDDKEKIKNIPAHYLIQHGANDNYKISELHPKFDAQPMGRMPGDDERFLVIHSDGTHSVIGPTEKLMKFYKDTLKVKWPYHENYTDPPAPKPTTDDEKKKAAAKNRKEAKEKGDPVIDKEEPWKD